MEVYYQEAIKLLGRPMTVEELFMEAKRDILIYKYTHAGVTISGGEPLLNPGFIGKLLNGFEAEGICVGVDTCGHVPWTSIKQMLPYIDFFLWDITHMNPDQHRLLMGSLTS